MRNSFRRMAGATLLGGLLYGAILGLANQAVAQDLTEAQLAELETMATGEMEKLVFHEPYDPIEETWKDQHGNTQSFEDYRGKVVVTNFWATWCPPCTAEMPSLDRLAGELEGSDIVVVPISLDHLGVSRIVDFFAEIDAQHLGVHHDRPKKVGRRAGILGLPVTAIMDREGREIARMVGEAEWDSPEAKVLLKRISEMTAADHGLKDAALPADPAG